VHASFRNKGFGKDLVLAAEKYGKEQGCLFGAVNTFDWKALEFYKKLGYFVYFERYGFVKNSVFYFLRKIYE
jgi:ribosomal protein S18 acetylase RimI-like enzyme